MAIAKKKPAVKKAVAAPAKTAAKKTVAVKKAPVKKTVLKTVTAAKTAAVKKTPVKKVAEKKTAAVKKAPSKQCSIPLPPGLFQPTRVPEPCFTFVLPLSSLLARREERGIAYIPNIPNGEATRCKPLKNALVGDARHAIRS